MKMQGLSQKVWLKYNGTSSRIGIPFHFLLRDILQVLLESYRFWTLVQYDTDVPAALHRIHNAARTCSIFIGLGDPVHQFSAVEYSYQVVNVYNDTDYPINPGHPRIPHVVYIDKVFLNMFYIWVLQHEQPSSDPCLGSLLKKYYGKIDPIVTLQYITAVFQTGDMHIAIYDFSTMQMYVSNASPYVNGTFTPAYDRPFTR